MQHQISCTRCGNVQSPVTNTECAWEEINCIECGEFLDTYGHWEDSVSPSYLIQTLNRSRMLTLQMARESRPVNDYRVGDRVSA
ncbi:hypothetical protein [Salinicola halophilus]|uniref:hypothetical protein n=1 Tax=Salinicola halophilus TaxID=184065 RepID=UPI000DA18A9F|nr:hypothetical protein [Salinicola halophilus]